MHHLFITDLSLHSIGILLYRVGRYELFTKFLEDLIIDGMKILSLNPDELKKMHEIAQNFHLDFDDAYQYAVAEKNLLQLISFDQDFDKTEKGRKEPLAIISI